VIAGLDFSTKSVDCVLLSEDADEARWFRRRIEAASALEAARKVRDVLPARGAWRDEGVVAVGIERPFGHPATVTALMRVQGAILSCIAPEIPVYEIAPSSWMKRFGGKGDATKSEIRERATPFFADPPRQQDLYDACGIAAAARQIHDETTTRKEAA
jgi:Holliday junction resolvasome RuvABC endonuclease subunit